MATKKPFETLSEEQKARREEILQQQRDQLAADASAVPEVTNSPTAAPEQLNEVTVVAERPTPTPAPAPEPDPASAAAAAPTQTPAPAPVVPNAETWRQDKLAADIAASAPTVNVSPANKPVELREATVVADRNQPASPAQPAQAPAAPPTEPQPSLGQQLLAKDRAAALAVEQGLEPPADLENPNVDPYVAAVAKASRDEQRTFAEWALAQKKDDEKAIKDSEEQVNADLRASKWTGLTELAASIANLIGVGEGNAVSQQYKPYSQDWMKKADQDMREHRSRIENLRQRQRDTELKMQQLRSQTDINMAKVKKDAMAQAALADYRRAQTALQNAKTETERQKALLDAEQAAMKMELMGAQTSAYYALSGQREAAARAALQNAASRASAVENQNANRDSRTAAQNERDYANAEKARGGTSSSQRSGKSTNDLIKNL